MKAKPKVRELTGYLKELARMSAEMAQSTFTADKWISNKQRSVR